MTKKDYITYLIDAFKQNDLGDIIDEEKAEKFHDLYKYLIEYNSHTNLTAITDEKEVILKHFIDCAAVSKHIEANSNVIDIGCGAGFPSLPIAIVRPDLQITSLDSTSKKINFVKNAIDLLGLKSSSAICARAEEFASDNRGAYDVCVSRAVARLNILAELCLPLVKKKGIFIAMKSNKGADELSEAKNCIKTLGAEHIDTKYLTFSINELDPIEREIQIFAKTSQTPLLYPRKYAQILKKPL
jgi:16S rRNA (guanine527-N7)-methyltransferase